MTRPPIPDRGSPCSWLAYDLTPRTLPTLPRPAMYGNGQLQLFADLGRPCIGEAACFGFGKAGLRIREGQWGIQHLLPAVYRPGDGRKYTLSATRSSGAREAKVTLRPDRQVWRFVFDDLRVDVSLILPRLRPGYLLKVELTPADGDATDWLVDHQARATQGMSPMPQFFSRDTHQSRDGGCVWWEVGPGHAEGIGATVDADEIALGLDCGHTTDIRVRLRARSGERASALYCARAFGATAAEVRQNLAELLADAPGLETAATAWWDTYLAEVPRVETPDEAFDRTILWSWANFRSNRVDVPIGDTPAGLFSAKAIRVEPIICYVDNLEAEAIQLLHDPRPARDTVVALQRRLIKHGLLGAGYQGDHEGRSSYTFSVGWLAGLLQRYILTTGDLALLSEEVGGVTVFDRVEDALEAQLTYRDERTGLFRNDGETAYFFDPERRLATGMEGTGRFRLPDGGLLNDTSAATWGALLAVADLAELAGRSEAAARYRRVADELEQAIQRHLWREDIGFFGELRADGSFSDYVGMGGFVTGLFAVHPYRPGGLATPEQAARLAAWCEHPDFASDLGVVSLARSHPHFDPADFTGFGGGFDMHWCNQLVAGLYAHGQYDEAHRQLVKLWRRLGENAGLGPRYRGEAYNSDTGEIYSFRYHNYPAVVAALSSVIEGVFGLRWTLPALTAEAHAPWPWARLSNLRLRDAILDLELTADGALSATIDGREVARGADGRLSLPWGAIT